MYAFSRTFVPQLQSLLPRMAFSSFWAGVAGIVAR
jgi:hypothetical protein